MNFAPKYPSKEPSYIADDSYSGALIEETLLKVLEIYQPEDIFNCQETGLYYNAMPECSPKNSNGDIKITNETNDETSEGEKAEGESGKAERESEKAEGESEKAGGESEMAEGEDNHSVVSKEADNQNGSEKSSKVASTYDRMTLLLCCNMAGSEKLRPLIICNNTTVKLEDNEAPVIYKTNNYGLMTTDLFASWLEDLDKTMEKDKRQICMILTDVDEHTSRCALNNIRLVYVPPGTTSFTHPLNHGIIQNFKALYRQQTISKMHVQKSDDLVNSTTKLGVLDGIFMLSESWDQVKQSTIQNCFMKAMMGAASVNESNEVNENEVVSPPQNMTKEEFHKFVNIDDHLQCFATSRSPLLSKYHVPHESPSVGEMLANIEKKVQAMSENGSSPPRYQSTPLRHTASPINLAKDKSSIGINLSHSANSSRNQSPVMFDGGEHPRKKNKLDKLAHRLMNGEDKSSSPKTPSTSSVTNHHSKSISSSSSSASTKSTPKMLPNMAAANPFMQFQMLNMMQHQLNPLMAANTLSPALNPFVQGATQNPSHQDALVALDTLRQYLESRNDEACLGAFKVFDAFVRFSIMRNLQQRM
ncbi:hypothetical protein LOTGIDRAFT_160412 [Lottia gigantea]|uniref:DDE-1 domain-containing protein n=1 Tax=Lottia gigantea TaxID=225164 RepID=V4AEI1_LOTGI|nr:hypothetical protein LOTGIDRAFT_160412 [Lottia gigantea]ESO95292.1 hypothetical protein LOTGIDRAFT_160412 [Lottia gigantea]